MDINITKETLNINRMVCEKKEMITIEGDMIVPDSKPDILNTINTSGNVCIYKKEVMDEKLRIDGNVLLHIMYVADGEKDNIRGLNTGIDFSETINVSELKQGMEVNIIPKIKLIECKIINGRKIGIKISLELNLKIYSKEGIDIITGIENDDIQVLKNDIKVNSLIGNGNTKTVVKENISIPNTDNLVEILKLKIELVDRDIKISYNKILAKSEVEVNIVYLTEDGRICSIKNRLPLVGFIDMPNIKEDDICDVNYLIKNIIIKPNTVEEHSVYVEVEVEISCMTYEEKQIQIIEDMYCPCKKLKFEKSVLNTVTNNSSKNKLCNTSEKLNVPELESGDLIDVETEPVINNENKLNGKIILEGELNLNLVFTDNSYVGISTKKVTIPFEQNIENIEDCDDSKINTVIEISNQEYTKQGGMLNTNVDMNIGVNTLKNTNIPIIDNITIEEDDNLEDYSVIIYVVKKGDTLWKIAKRFGSTVDDIVRVNGIERPEKINIGEKIYIPKYVLKRTKEPIAISQNG